MLLWSVPQQDLAQPVRPTFFSPSSGMMPAVIVHYNEQESGIHSKAANLFLFTFSNVYLPSFRIFPVLFCSLCQTSLIFLITDKNLCSLKC